VTLLYLSARTRIDRTRRWRQIVGFLVPMLLFAAVGSRAAQAHPLDPGLLSLHVDGEQVAADWTPPPGAPDLTPMLPEVCSPRTLSPGARRLVAACTPTLFGELTVPDLPAAKAEVVVRVHTPRHVTTSTLTRDSPALVVRPDAQPPGLWATLQAYIRLGVPHVLGGADHVLFVVGLVLLVRRMRDLLLTITAFTLAHSVALALAALGTAQLPAGPVEACIALSILMLAVELARGEATLMRRAPWLVAGTLGLVHGLGFAGVLSAVGLPAGRAPEALLGFNVGVEIGQLGVVAVALPVIALSRRGPPWLERAAIWALGAVGAAWTLDRVIAMLGA
jgi:hypothetical protein